MMSLQSHAFPIQFSLHDKTVYDSQKMLQIHTILLPCSSMNRIPSLQHCCAFDSRKDGSECIAIPGRAGVASRLLLPTDSFSLCSTPMSLEIRKLVPVLKKVYDSFGDKMNSDFVQVMLVLMSEQPWYKLLNLDNRFSQGKPLSSTVLPSLC